MIFCYLRGTVNAGLWYMKDSGFKLTGFSDADYMGCKVEQNFSAKARELVLKETRLYIAVNREIRICVSIYLLCSSPLDADAVNRLWLSLQQDPNLFDDGNPSRANIKQALGRTLSYWFTHTVLSALRRSGSIYTDQRGTVVIETVFDEVTKTLSSISVDY
ncbi:hypothetical protein Tco_0903124 [Tanacetum coccineum]